MHILNFPFFFGINNTGYPTNNCDGWIYPFFRFSLTNSLKAKFSVSVNLYIGKNFSIIPGFRLILESYNIYSASLLLSRL